MIRYLSFIFSGILFRKLRYEHLLSYMTKTTPFKVNDERPNK